MLNFECDQNGTALSDLAELSYKTNFVLEKSEKRNAKK